MAQDSNSREVQRAAAFQELTNRYIRQIRHGCKSVYCQYPYCWSCRQRLATSPPRRPTLATARLQAYVLATKADPYAGLCQNEPITGMEEAYESKSGASTSKLGKKDNKSLTQCLLDTASFHRFERHGFAPQPVASISSDQALLSPSKDRCTLISNCWEDLRPLFVAPPSLRQSLDSEGLEYVSQSEALNVVIRSLFLILNGPTSVTGGPDFDQEPALELALALTDRLARTIAARRCHWEIAQLKTRDQSPFNFVDKALTGLALLQLRYLSSSDHLDYSAIVSGRDQMDIWNQDKNMPPGEASTEPAHTTKDAVDSQVLGSSRRLVFWLGALIKSRWIEAHTFRRWDTVGASFEIIEDLIRICLTRVSHDPPRYLELERLIKSQVRPIIQSPGSLSVATSFIDFESDPNTKHLLNYPMVLDDSFKVQHFRTIHYATMLNSFRQAHYHDFLSDLNNVALPRGRFYLEERLKVARARYLTLDVGRDTAFEDAADQLRGREKRELQRPLKVLIGRSEAGGETGLDQGGLTQEFFALVAATVFDPNYSMFTTEESSHFSWFRPLSPVPLYKYELLGVLFSLALYNGTIIPVNLPKVLYRRLLFGDDRVSLKDIEDGWPDLAASFRQLYNWDENSGDVADILLREYKFSFDTPELPPNGVADGWQIVATSTRGLTVEYDLRTNAQVSTSDGSLNGGSHMSKEETDGMVTNRNRRRFIRDYTHFLLVDSIRPQYDAFARGFHTLMTPKALSLLCPSLLQRLTEGNHELSMFELERVATYENGYFPAHPVIQHFWSHVRTWPKEKQRKLLAFVTASDRVPVTGLATVAFSIVRNGAVENLPTSQTCFGKLNLPEYKDKQTLEKMLDIAIEYGQGFGVV